jgi:DNA-binding IclR family transcriptional regulator
MTDDDRKPQRTGVISRAASILEAFRPAHRELSLNDLARRSGLPTSTVYRMVVELMEHGLLERVGSSGYRIGLRLWELGALAERPNTMVRIVLPFMQDLYVVTHENIQLAILDGHEALFIEKIYGARSAPTRSTRGGRLPLHATGVGQVLLAHAPQQLVDELVEKGLEGYTQYTLTTARQLARRLSEVRRAGVAFQREEMDLGLSSVAAPVTDVTGAVVASLSVVLRSSRHQLRQLAPAVLTAAASASRELREARVAGASVEGLMSVLVEARVARTSGGGS